MSSSEVLNNLNIRKFSSRAALKAAQNVGANDLCITTDNAEAVLQSDTIPAPIAELEGEIYMATRTMSGTGYDFTRGYFYQCQYVTTEPRVFLSSTNISCDINNSTFAEYVEPIDGNYNFAYDGSAWILNQTAQVDPADYGITVYDTPWNGAYINIEYTAPFNGYKWVRMNVQPGSETQVTTMPTASAEYVGKILQYLGTDGNYNFGWFYTCYGSDGNYWWNNVLVQNQTDWNGRLYSNFVDSGYKFIRFGGTFYDSDALYYRPIGECIVYLYTSDFSSVFSARVVINGTTLRQIIYNATGEFANASFYVYKSSSTATSSYVAIGKNDGTAFFSTETEVFWMVNTFGASPQSVDWFSLRPLTGGANAVTTFIPMYYDSVAQLASLPTVSLSNLGLIAQYSGASEGGLTNGYFYKSTGTVVVVPPSIPCYETSSTGTTITCVDPDAMLEEVASETGRTASYIKSRLTNYSWSYDPVNDTFTWWNYTLTTANMLQYFTFSPTPTTDTVTWSTGAYVNGYNEVQNPAWVRIDVQPSSGGGGGLPSQTGHAGEVLYTDGTDPYWDAVDALPSQTGHSGEILITDGTDASWTTPTTITFRTWGAGE